MTGRSVANADTTRAPVLDDGPADAPGRRSASRPSPGSVTTFPRDPADEDAKLAQTCVSNFRASAEARPHPTSRVAVYQAGGEAGEGPGWWAVGPPGRAARGRGAAGTASKWRAAVSWVVALGGLFVLVWQLPALAGDAVQVGSELARLSWSWVGAAVVLGPGALVAYGELHRRVLRAGGVRLRFRTVQTINVVENAFSTTLPAVGNAAGFVYATYQLRKNRVDVALAAWSLVLSGAVAAITLLVLGFLGLGLVGQIPVLAAGSAAALVVVGSWGCWRVVSSGVALHSGVRSLARLSRRLAGWSQRYRRSSAEWQDSVDHRVSDQVELLHPSRAQWTSIFSLAALSWVLDSSSLYASTAALGHPVPWPALVVGFLVVQASIALQLFPGGAGLAEAGLFGVLVVFGLPVPSAAGAVLIYRLVNWVGLAMLGWIVYAGQIHTSPEARGSSRDSPSRR